MNTNDRSKHTAERAAAQAKHDATVGFVGKSGQMFCGVCGRKVVQTAMFYRTGAVVHK
jgi:hypothetical protein